MNQQSRDRSRIHINLQQQGQYQTCTQSTERVRNTVREMARVTKGQSIDGQLRQVHEQLRNELQTMQQDRERLKASLGDEQRAQLQGHLQAITRSQEQLEASSVALGQTLNEANTDTARVRDQIQKMDRTSKELQRQQRELGADLETQ